MISSFIVSFFVYSGILPVKEKAFSCLCEKEKIRILEGKISSNPVKSNKGFYKIWLSPDFSYDENGGKYSSKGKVLLLVQEDSCEAYLPGKLYSLNAKNSVLCEKGLRLKVEGIFRENCFVVSKSENLPLSNSVFNFVIKIRSLSRLQFRRMMFAWKEAGGLFLALISGIKEYTESDIQDSFRASGLSHILALSGMHLSLFQGISKKALKGKTGEKTLLVVQFASILAFVWFSGFSPSLFRAFLCNSLVIIASLSKIKRISMLTVLSSSFLIHSAVFPEDLFNLAFMLSYGALLGILLFEKIFTVLFIRLIPCKLSKGLGSSCAAQFITAPLSLLKTGIFSPIGIIATVFVSPLINIFIYSGLFMFVLCLFFPFVSDSASFLMNLIYNFIRKFVLFFSIFPKIQL